MMSRHQILELAGTLAAARAFLLAAGPPWKEAADRLVGVLTALHEGGRRTAAELDRLGRVQMDLGAQFRGAVGREAIDHSLDA